MSRDDDRHVARPGPGLSPRVNAVNFDWLRSTRLALHGDRLAAAKHRAPTIRDVKRDNMQFTVSLAAVHFSYIVRGIVNTNGIELAGG